jgi:predicted nucleotidyltransferase
MGKKETFREGVETSFLDALRECFSDNLVSVMIYGSYVSDDFVPRVSDVNVLVLLDHSDPGKIRELGARAHRLIRRFKITPLILTRSEFANSADVFPMEYMDIADRNRVLFGEDETRSLSLERRNLRHQLEERLRGSVAFLRQVLVASRGRERVLRHNLKILYGSLKAIFKGLLRIRGVPEIPADGRILLEQLATSFKVQVDPFQRLRVLRRGEKQDTIRLADEVLAALQELISLIDRMSFVDE